MDVALTVEKDPAAAQKVADAYKALEDKVAEAKVAARAGSAGQVVSAAAPTQEQVEQALQLRALLKAKGLGYAVSSMTEAERTSARKLIRDALAFYVSGGKL